MSLQLQKILEGWQSALAAAPEGQADLYRLEQMLAQAGMGPVCGVDEVGRGPIAGPVAAGAVILDPARPIPGLNDSKKLSPKKREQLYEVITRQALAWSVATASVQEIDQMKIGQATFLAMARAVEGLGAAAALCLVDGDAQPPGGLAGIPCQTVVKGDGKCACIAAASIIAKVYRDRLMAELGRQYPGYHFEKHKGYGTPAHKAYVMAHGVPEGVYRQEFLETWLAGGQ